MKVYISVDMEGISGVVNWEETGKEGGPDYERARRVMTADLNAAVEGAFAGGATEVVANDSHGGMRNIVIEEVNPNIRLIRGSPKDLSMMQGINDSFDLVMFVGYHARSSTDGVLNHTYTGSVLHYKVNGEYFGETGMNAAVAGHFGVPVGLVTGDELVTAEARELLGPIETVAVKKQVGRYAADCLTPKKAQALIKAAAERAVKRASEFKPLALSKPITVELVFKDTAQANGAELMPGVKRVDPLTVAYTADDYLTCYKAARAMISLAR